MEKHYAIIRIASRCSRTAIGQANAHGNRSDVSAHVDRTRSRLNQFWVPIGHNQEAFPLRDGNGKGPYRPTGC